jgi:hypothetical protein
VHRIVLKNRDDAPWPKNANQVFEHDDRIGKALETLGTPNEVETLVWKWQAIEGGSDEIDRRSSGMACFPMPRHGDVGGIEIDTSDGSARSQSVGDATRVEAVAAGEVEHIHRGCERQRSQEPL